MPRFNVQHPVTKEWRCFSTIVDDYVTDWMDEERYQRWRLEQYGKQAGEIRDANLMDYEDAEQIIANRKRWEAEDEEETLKRETRFARIKNALTIEEMAQLLCKVSTCSLCVASGYCHNQHTGYIDWLKEEMEGSET